MEFMNPNSNASPGGKYAYILAFAAVLILGLSIIFLSPRSTINADAKRYLTQAKVINDYGLLGGFERLADSYIGRMERALSGKGGGSLPHHPLRAGRIILHSLFLNITPTMQASYIMSVIFYVLIGLLLFYFLSKIWNEKVAFIATSLALLSPLLLGYAAKPLSESQYYFFMLLWLFLLIRYLEEPSNRKAVVLAIVLALCLMFKEIYILFFPFIGISLLATKFLYNKNISYLQIGIICGLPFLILIPVYFILFGGYEKVWSMIQMQSERHLLGPTRGFSRLEKQGPWYQYFVDFMMLSQFASLIFLTTALSVLYFLKNNKKQFFAVAVLLSFFIYSVFAFDLLIKHVRYAVFWEAIYRLFITLALLYLAPKLFTKQLHQIAFIGGMCLLIVFNDLSQYHKFFVTYKVKKVTAYALSTKEGFFSPQLMRGGGGGKSRRPAAGKKLLRKSNTYMKQQEYEEAQLLAEVLYTYFDNNKNIQYNLCYSSLKLGYFDEAEQYCTELVDNFGEQEIIDKLYAKENEYTREERAFLKQLKNVD